MKTILSFWITISIFLSINCQLTYSQAVSITDSIALISLYNSTNGPEWTDNTNWLTGTLNTWYGITLESGRVVSISLENNNLNGNLPPEIGNLTELNILNLGKNSLSGEIPAELWNLSTLNSLILNQNQLTGPIPQEIGNLSHLTTLYIFDNQFTGAVPSTITQVPLQELFMSYNRFDELPSLEGMTTLNILRLHDNLFTFEDIEPNISVPNTEFFYFPQGLVGQEQSITIKEGESDTLCVSVGGEHNVYQWYKDGAIITGEQNDTLEISDALPEDAGDYTCQVTNTVATDLTLYSRPFHISVSIYDPAILNDSIALVALYNSTNGPEWTDNTNWLTGTLNTWYGITLESGRVVSISLENNNLNGNLPPEIGNLTELNILNLGKNSLSGEIPAELWNLSTLNSLILNQNQLTGPIPQEIGNLSHLTTLYIFDNQFTGAVPSTITQVPLQELFMSYNRFDELPSLEGMTTLNILRLHDNLFTFEDIEPNITVPQTEFLYSPQNLVGQVQSITINEGDNDTLFVSVGGEHNVYQWYKDGAIITGEQNDTLEISDALPEDAGVYSCLITNTIATDLTLYSRPITVILNNESVDPPVISNYNIVNGTDLKFDFAAIPTGSSMNAYRDTTAFFSPDKTGGSNRVATHFIDEDIVTSGVQWTDKDVIGDAATNYYYIFTIVDGSESENSKTIGEFDYNLITTPTTDFNEIALPLAIQGLTSAADLLESIPGCNSVARWNSGIQGYEQYTPLFEETNFEVRAGYPYYVNVTEDVVFTLTGEIANPQFNLITTPTTDFNDIMLTLDKTSFNSAFDLMSDIPSCNSVARWSPGVQGYEQYIPIFEETNFGVRVGYPYYVNMTSNINWPNSSGGSLKSTYNESTVMIEKNSAPHLVYGAIKINNSELTLDDLDFSAYFQSSPEDKLGRNSAGCMLKKGYFVVQCNSFSSGWRVEEPLKVELKDKNGIVLNSTDVQLSYNPVDKAQDLILESEQSDILSQNIPNPFTEETLINYQIPDEGLVILEIYSIAGQKIKILVNDNQKAGGHEVIWNGCDDNNQRVSDGMYIYLLRTRDTVVYKKAMVVK
jgi:Leucine-rich repeat (LRR) protein